MLFPTVSGQHKTRTVDIEGKGGLCWQRGCTIGIGEIGGPYGPGQISRANPRAGHLSREKARGKLMLSQYRPLVVGLWVSICISREMMITYDMMGTPKADL